MAGYFSGTVAAALNKQAVGMTLLGRFSFPAIERRLAMTSGRVQFGGEWWEGVGAFVSVSALSAAAGDAALPVTFTLSGVDDDIVALAAADAPAIRGRAVTLYLQFFSPKTFQPYDDPVAIWSGVMDRVTMSRSAQSRSVTLICESALIGRSRSAYGLLTDMDQQARSPGDKFLEFAPLMLSRVDKWP